MNCPNKNLEEYKLLVDKYGEVGAMKAYVLNGEDIPSLDKAEELLNHKSIELQREVLPPTKDELDYLKRMFNVQNSTYDITKGNKRIHGINKWLDTNNYNYKAVLSKKPDGISNIITFIKYSPISHSKGVNLNPITKEVITPILDKLSAKFGLKYRYSTAIKDKAQYDPNTDGVIVNPNLMDLDSPFHEFAHPFIKILKNQNQVLYAKLRFEILKEAKILSEVKKLYPELGKESQIEEAIVTSIGLMSAEEYSKSSLKKTIDKVLDWIYNLIRSAFGKYKPEYISDLDYNTSLRDIAKLIVGDDFNDLLLNTGDTNIAAQKNKESNLSYNEMHEIMHQEESSFEHEAEHLEVSKLKDIQTVVKKAVENLEFKIKHENQHSLGGTVLRKTFHDLITRLSEVKAQEGLIDALVEAKISINGYYNQYLKARQDGTFNIKALSTWRTNLLGYSWLEDLQAIIKNNSDDLLGDLKDVSLSKQFLETEIVTQLDNILSKRNIIQKAFVKEGLPIIAKTLARYSTYGEAKFKEEQERIYRELPKSTRDLFTFKQYITSALEYNDEFIQEVTENKIIDELKMASKDINLFLRWLDNIMDSPDYVMSAAGSMFTKALWKTNAEIYTVKDRILEHLKPLEKFLNYGPTKSIDSFYDFLLEKTDKGEKTGHYIWKWRSSMMYDYVAEKDEIQNSTKYTLDEKKKILATLKDKYAVRDNDAYFDARWEHIEDLHKDGIITDEDYANLRYNEGIIGRFNERRAESIGTLVKDGRLTQSAAAAISAWENEYDWVFRTPVEKYLNPQWKELQKLANSKSDDINDWSDADPRIKFFKFMVQLGKEADKKVPRSKRLGTRLPGMLKTAGEAIKAGEGKTLIENFKYKFKNLWTPDPEESSQDELIKEDPKLKRNKKSIKERTLKTALIDSEGKLHKVIPIRFTTKYDPKEMSYDVATLYMGYYGSASKYANKQEILPEMEMIQYLLSNRDVAHTKKGKPILRDLVGGISNINTDARVKKPNEEKSRIADQFNDFMNIVMFEDSAPKSKIEKFIDTLSQYTAFRVLSVNLLAGIGNVMTGETMQKVEALAGQFFSVKDLEYATSYYYKNIVGLVKDIGVGQRQSENIINLLNEKFMVLNEDTLVKFRKNTGIQHMWNKSKMFFLMHAGEHFMQSRLNIAMLNHIKAKDKNGDEIIIDSGVFKGRPLSILDAYKVIDNKLVLDPRVDLKKSKWTEDDQYKYLLRFKSVASHMHGAYSEQEKVAIQRVALGRMVYQFKKYMVPNIRRRWAAKYLNNQIGEFTEGNYITFGRWFKELGREFYVYTLSNLSDESRQKFIDTYGKAHTDIKDVWDHLTYSGFTESEFANIRRTTAELGVFMGIAILLRYIIPMLDDDDDKDNILFNKAMVNYIILRLYSEWTMYVNPMEAQKLIQSPAASYSVIQDTIKLFTQLTDPFAVYQRGTFKGDNKLYHRLLDLFPILRVYNKILDAKQQSSIFKRYNIFVPKQEKEKNK